MEEKMEKPIRNSDRIIEAFFLIFLILFPLRHVCWGGDLWDVGYNYANFRYDTMQSLGKMWYFSTFLATKAGHLLTVLPFGHTLIGLNIYTGLVESLIGVMGYLFCTRKLKFPGWIVFTGEVIALSLCWCPTAKLYDYLTYLLLTTCVILIYLGLTGEKGRYLFLAGICLGINIFVRFSNLPEMALIFGVWAYALIEGLERRRKDQGNGDAGKKPGRSAAGWIFARIGKTTAFCVSGYLTAIGIGFGWIAIRYGIGEYLEGIRLLFTITDTAADYKPLAMVYGVLWPFKEAIYWVIRIAVFLFAAVAAGAIEDIVSAVTDKKFRRIRSLSCWLSRLGIFAVIVIMLYWLYTKRGPGFSSFFYRSYDPIVWPATLMMMLGIGFGLFEVFRRGSTKEEKLIGGLIVIVLPVTSLGSNNGLYPSWNNFFLAAPYVLGELYKLTKACAGRVRGQQNRLQKRFRINLIPAMAGMWAWVIFCFLQFFIFGLSFSFCEATGLQETGYRIVNNSVLNGVTTDQNRAKWLSEISEYATQQNLKGQEVILYGWIPALSFYLEMPPAFHAWSDLDSFKFELMQNTMQQLRTEIDQNGKIPPVVIAEKKYAYDNEETKADQKWQLIVRFMEEYGYRKNFENEKFVIWQKE